MGEGRDLILRMTGYELDGKEVAEALCDDLDEKGLIVASEWLYAGMGLRYILSEKGTAEILAPC